MTEESKPVRAIIDNHIEALELRGEASREAVSAIKDAAYAWACKTPYADRDKPQTFAGPLRVQHFTCRSNPEARKALEALARELDISLRRAEELEAQSEPQSDWGPGGRIDTTYRHYKRFRPAPTPPEQPKASEVAADIAPPVAPTQPLPQPAGGTKYDDGKAPLWLVPWEALRDRVAPDCAVMACALVSWARREEGSSSRLRSTLSPERVAGAAEVLAFGAEKYAAWNWEKGFKFTRVASAGLRHALWIPNDGPTDPESGLSHSYHLACNVIFAVTLDERHSSTEWDDRPPAPERD